MDAPIEEVFEVLKDCRPREDNFYGWAKEELGMSEQIWAIRADLTDNPWATL